MDSTKENADKSYIKERIVEDKKYFRIVYQVNPPGVIVMVNEFYRFEARVV